MISFFSPLMTSTKKKKKKKIEDKTFKPYQAKEALSDPKTWVWFLFCILVAIPNSLGNQISIIVSLHEILSLNDHRLGSFFFFLSFSSFILESDPISVVDVDVDFWFSHSGCLLWLQPQTNHLIELWIWSRDNLIDSIGCEVDRQDQRL